MHSYEEQKPTKYYVDFENVHGAGLKGIDELGERDEVLVFYSQAAETFHIEHAISILKSKARVEFIEIDGGTRNSLDFQLVAALFGTISEEYDYAIVSGDGGFDAAIKMGQRLELPNVRRITDLTGSTEAPPVKSTRTRRTRRTSSKEQKEQGGQQEQQVQQPQNASNGQQPQQEEKEQPEASSNGADEAQVDQDSSSDKETAGASSRSGRYSKRKEVKALLVENGVTLNQQQLSSVMKALNGVKNKQGFYRSIIQLEKQERGLELYRQVRDYYEKMVEILRS